MVHGLIRQTEDGSIRGRQTLHVLNDVFKVGRVLYWYPYARPRQGNHSARFDRRQKHRLEYKQIADHEGRRATRR